MLGRSVRQRRALRRVRRVTPEAEQLRRCRQMVFQTGSGIAPLGEGLMAHFELVRGLYEKPEANAPAKEE
jgi:hypothetical protein